MAISWRSRPVLRLCLLRFASAGAESQALISRRTAQASTQSYLQRLSPGQRPALFATTQELHGRFPTTLPGPSLCYGLAARLLSPAQPQCGGPLLLRRQHIHEARQTGRQPRCSGSGGAVRSAGNSRRSATRRSPAPPYEARPAKQAFIERWLQQMFNRWLQQASRDAQQQLQLGEMQKSLAQPQADAIERAWQQFVGVLDQRVDDHESLFGGINVATAMQQLALVWSATGRAGPIGGSAELVAGKLHKLMEQSAAWLQPRELATFAWACAKLGVRPPERLSTALAARAASTVRRFNDADASNILWACAEWQCHPLDGLLLEQLAGHIQRRSYRFSVHNLAIVMWAYAKLGLNPLDGQLYNTLARNAMAKIELFSPWQLSMLMTAACAMENAAVSLHGPLIRVVSCRIMQDLSSFSAHTLVAIMQSLGGMQHHSQQRHRCWQAVAQQSLRTLPSFGPQGLAMLMWASAKLGYGGPVTARLFALVGDRAIRELDRFDPQQLALMMWASAKVGPQACSHPFFRAAALHALQRIDAYEPQGLSLIAWACGKLGDRSVGGRLLQAIDSHAGSRMAAFKPQELCNVLWAHAKLQHVVSEELLEAVADKLVLSIL